MFSDLNIPFVDRTAIVLSSVWPDVKLPKQGEGTEDLVVDRSMLSCCIEAVTEYSRILYDLFPQAQLCICVADDASATASPLFLVNQWHQQSVQDVMEGLARAKSFRSGPSASVASLESATAAAIQLLHDDGPLSRAPHHPIRGRLVYLTPAAADATNALVDAVRAAATPFGSRCGSLDVHQVRISAADAPADADARRTILARPHTWFRGCSMSLRELPTRWGELIDAHFALRRLEINGIPMKEKDGEQRDTKRAIYSVRLVHPRGQHGGGTEATHWRGASDGRAGNGGRLPAALAATCVHRLTPLDVHAPPTQCLLKHLVAASRSVLVATAPSPAPPTHLLQLHGSDVWLHCLWPAPPLSPLETLPASALAAYQWPLNAYGSRLEAFSQLMRSAQLPPSATASADSMVTISLPSASEAPSTVSVPSVLERLTRCFPYMEQDTVLLAPELGDPLRRLSAAVCSFLLEEREDSQQASQCAEHVAMLHAMASANATPGFPAQLANASAARQQAHRRLWIELLNLAARSAAVAPPNSFKPQLLAAMQRLWPELANEAPAALSSGSAAASSASAPSTPTAATTPVGGRKRDREGEPAVQTQSPVVGLPQQPQQLQYKNLYNRFASQQPAGRMFDGLNPQPPSTTAAPAISNSSVAAATVVSSASIPAPSAAKPAATTEPMPLANPIGTGGSVSVSAVAPVVKFGWRT